MTSASLNSMDMRAIIGLKLPFANSMNFTYSSNRNALLTIFTNDREQALSLALHQVLALCGDGRLVDSSDCSHQFRDYLSRLPSEKLFHYLNECLTAALERGGAILQDLVNELGRRLDYRVENGLYQGRSNAVGYDGLWQTSSGATLVIEVKTTDAYRINLDTVVGYRNKLIVDSRIPEASSVLIVVGRQDTGDLEAQVRGSRHAWTVRIISVDALMKLVSLKEQAEEDTVEKIRDLLTPFEYTRLDRIIEIAFTVARETSSVIEEDASGLLDSEKSDNQPRIAVQTHTSTEILSSVREDIVNSIGQLEKVALVRKSAALYRSPDSSVRVVASVSKRYPQGSYWYAFHPEWDSFLQGASKSFYAIGCVDKPFFNCLPHTFIHDRLPFLNTTTTVEGKTYWHVKVDEDESGCGLLRLDKKGERVDLSQFKVSRKNL